MLNYDVTKLTAELKSTDNAQYKNKIYYFLVALVGVGYRKHVGLHTVIYPNVDCWAWASYRSVHELNNLLSDSRPFNVIANGTIIQIS